MLEVRGSAKAIGQGTLQIQIISHDITILPFQHKNAKENLRTTSPSKKCVILASSYLRGLSNVEVGFLFDFTQLS